MKSVSERINKMDFSWKSNLKVYGRIYDYMAWFDVHDMTLFTSDSLFQLICNEIS